MAAPQLYAQPQQPTTYQQQVQQQMAKFVQLVREGIKLQRRPSEILHDVFSCPEYTPHYPMFQYMIQMFTPVLGELDTRQGISWLSDPARLHDFIAYLMACGESLTPEQVAEIQAGIQQYQQ